MFDKIDVNGPNAHPLYRLLRTQQPASVPGDTRPKAFVIEPGAIEWNFVKFLVGQDGTAMKRFKPAVDPLDFEGDGE